MTQLLRSYLLAYLFVLGISLGCLGFLLLHSLVGGDWGKASRRILQAGADTLPWLAALFIPILFGLGRIYPWMHPTPEMNESFTAGHKAIYFQLPFFIFRAALYFAAWVWLARQQRHSSKGQSAVGLLLYIFTLSLASFDWIMSLEPQWSSSIYGLMILVGDALSALAFVVLVLRWQEQRGDLKTPVTDDTTHDLGNLMLAFVMLWAYMGLSQYLIIWSANLPEEIGWYLARQRGGWQAVALLLIFFQFILPFLLLLARQRKRKLASLSRVAGLILALRVVDLFWLTAPDFSPGRFSLHLTDIALVVFVSWGWMVFFQHRLSIAKEVA